MSLSRATRKLINSHITSAVCSNGALWDAFESSVVDAGKPPSSSKAAGDGAGSSAGASSGSGSSPNPNQNPNPNPTPSSNPSRTPPSSASASASASPPTTSPSPSVPTTFNAPAPSPSQASTSTTPPPAPAPTYLHPALQNGHLGQPLRYPSAPVPTSSSSSLATRAADPTWPSAAHSSASASASSSGPSASSNAPSASSTPTFPFLLAPFQEAKHKTKDKDKGKGKGRASARGIKLWGTQPEQRQAAVLEHDSLDAVSGQKRFDTLSVQDRQDAKDALRHYMLNHYPEGVPRRYIPDDALEQRYSPDDLHVKQYDASKQTENSPRNYPNALSRHDTINAPREQQQQQQSDDWAAVAKTRRATATAPSDRPSHSAGHAEIRETMAREQEEVAREQAEREREVLREREEVTAEREQGADEKVANEKVANKRAAKQNTVKEKGSKEEKGKRPYMSKTGHRLANLGNVRVTPSTTEVLEARSRVKEKVQRVIRQAYGREYWVEFFGSTRYGVSHVRSDLDMVVLDPAHAHGYIKLNIKKPIYNTRSLANVLKKAGFTKIESRARSAVPIVRFTDKNTGLDCDVNVNERLGLINSDLIKTYCRLNPLLRPLLFMIKEWAKQHELNSPSTPRVPASFSSYALALMSIGFLQSQGMLPNLQDGYAPLSSKEEIKQHCVWTQKPHQGWDVRFQRSPPAFPGAVEIDRYDMLIKWFRFWETFSYTEQSIDVRRGGVVPREPVVPSEDSKQKGSEPPSPICVIDPFIVTKNTTRAISSKVLHKFVRQCRVAAGEIEKMDEFERAAHWPIYDEEVDRM